MRSRTADQLTEQRARRLTALSAAERGTLVLRLGEQGIRSYMITFRVDRADAIRRIKATHRLGRRPSRCAADDD